MSFFVRRRRLFSLYDQRMDFRLMTGQDSRENERFHSLCKGDRYETDFWMFGDSGGGASDNQCLGDGAERLHNAERVRRSELSLIKRHDDRLFLTERFRREQLLLLIRRADRLHFAERIRGAELPLVERCDDRLFLTERIWREQLQLVERRDDRLFLAERIWREQLQFVERRVKRLFLAERFWRAELSLVERRDDRLLFTERVRRQQLQFDGDVERLFKAEQFRRPKLQLGRNFNGDIGSQEEFLGVLVNSAVERIFQESRLLRQFVKKERRGGRPPSAATVGIGFVDFCGVIFRLQKRGPISANASRRPPAFVIQRPTFVMPRPAGTAAAVRKSAHREQVHCFLNNFSAGDTDQKTVPFSVNDFASAKEENK